MKLIKTAAVFILFFFGTGVFAGHAGKASDVNAKDIEYLKGVYKATFHCLDFYCDPDTGFALDVSPDKKETSICNIGIVMASVAVAGKTGLITEAEAVQKLEKMFVSLEKIKKFNGFPVTWVNVKTAEPAYGPKFSYADHNASLICSLLTVAGLYPEKFSQRVKKFIEPMDFKSTYDPRMKMIKGGFDLDRNDFDVKQSWGDWYYNILASDVRHFGLLGMGSGQIPEDYWKSLNRNTGFGNPIDQEMVALLKKKNSPLGKIYYWPGVEGGGLFMQYLPGIFLPEKNLPMGQSARVMALGEIELAKANKYFPLWGLSASETPDGNGYLGWGTMKKTVVTPHASVLAIADFPKEAVANLRSLEKKNMRPKVDVNGQIHDFGFTDSYDTETGTASKHYLSLDQGMLFLSLANYLYDDIVRKGFADTELGTKTIAAMESLEKKSTLK